MNDQELREAALHLLLTQDQQSELEGDFTRTFQKIQRELQSRGTRRFYFKTASGETLAIGYDTASFAPTLNVEKLLELIDRKTWMSVSDQGPRVLNPDKLASAIARGKISEQIVAECLETKKDSIRRVGPRALTKQEKEELTNA